MESPLSLATYINGINSRSSRSGKQTQIHHIVDELLSSSFVDSDFVATQVPSSSMFAGTLSESKLSEPHLSSSASDQLSPSSSSSALLPIPSPSVSSHSLPSIGNASSASETPSPSVSSSRASQVPSPSESVGKSESSNGSVPHSDSLKSDQLSSSSSKSSTSGGSDVDVPDRESGLPSPSVSLEAERASGKSSTLFPTKSPSRSSSCESQIISPSESTGTLDASSGSDPHDSSGPSAHPSRSLSDCRASQIPSLSSSIGTENWSSESELHMISSVSMNESLSSSLSM